MRDDYRDRPTMTPSMTKRLVRLTKPVGYKCLLCGEEHGLVASHQPNILFTNGYPNGLCPMSGRWMGITHEGESVWSEELFEYSWGIFDDDMDTRNP